MIHVHSRKLNHVSSLIVLHDGLGMSLGDRFANGDWGSGIGDWGSVSLDLGASDWW